MRLSLVSAFVLAFALLPVDNVWAQAEIGVRAQGLGGAFVGVADDATAVYWNPSGLATGAFVSFVADYSRLDPKHETGLNPQTTGFVGVTVPPVGVAYYRLPAYSIPSSEPAVSGSGSREEGRRSVRTSTVGVALLQSIGEYLVVGSTLKVVHLDGGGTRGDADVSAMAADGKVRLGAVVRNLTAPSFSLDAAGSEAVELQRQARVGIGWGSGWPGISRLVVAVDADVLSRAMPNGDRRDVAAGVETWWRAQRLGIRGGLRRSLIGDGRGVIAAGASAALKPGTFVEGHVARGAGDGNSWSVGVRIAF